MRRSCGLYKPLRFAGVKIVTLSNQACLGVLVFNRVSMIKDPETGKRVSRPNLPEKWQVVGAPQRRIVHLDHAANLAGLA